MQPRKLSHGILKTWFLPLRDIFSISTQRKSSRSGIYILMLNMEGCPQHLNLEISNTGNGPNGIFSGNLSMDFTEDSKWKMKMSRNGFCGMQSKKFDGFIDLDAYNTISLKVKGDGRCYISTIYTENWVNSPGQEEDNSWQAFVFVPKDNWYIAKAFVYFGELYSVVSKFRFCVMVTKY